LDNNEEKGQPPAEGFVPIEQVAGVAAASGEAAAKKPRPHIAFKEMVAGRLAQSGPQVRDAVVSTLTDAQIERRKKAVLSIIEKLDGKDRELQKGMRAGAVVFGPDEKPLPPTFTKEQLESNKKLREEISKMESALSKALESNDWSRLFDLS